MCDEQEYDFNRYLHPLYDEEEIIIRSENICNLLNSGRVVWNNWAKELINHIESNGLNYENYSLQVCDKEFNKASFHGYIYPITFIFCRCFFKGGSNFSRSNFRNGATFRSCYFYMNTSFQHTKFHGNASFDNSAFLNIELESNVTSIIVTEDEENIKISDVYHSTFDDSIFYKGSNFTKSYFETKVSFCRVDFFHDSDGSYHEEYVKHFGFPIAFDDSSFAKNVDFISANFWHAVSFREVKFNKNANFINSTFLSISSFDLAEAGNLILDKAKFTKIIPSFKYITLKNPPFLSNITLPKSLEKISGSIDKYQQLKRLAIASHDYEQELIFFSNELELKNHNRKKEIKIKSYVDKIKYISLLPNYLYKWLSNYGQSISRPIISLLILMIVFSTYIATAPTAFDSERFSTNSTPGKLKALHLMPSYDCRKIINSHPMTLKYSFYYSSQAISPIQFGTDQEIEKLTYCLFNDEVPPFWYKTLAAVVKLLGIILIFLLGLGIRNRFRIR